MARTKFETVIRKARFNAPGYSPQTMVILGDGTISDIQARMDRAQDVYDMASMPLSKRYAEWKSKKYGSEVRDLKATGRTRRAMKTLEAGQNYAILGFSDPVAAQRARLNNRLSRQWGLSPVNIQNLLKRIQDVPDRPVVAVQEK